MLETIMFSLLTMSSKSCYYSSSKDKEFGVSRGVDFKNVSNVINFDFPTTVESYIHRVGRWVIQSCHRDRLLLAAAWLLWGFSLKFFCLLFCRTARADNPGTALSFISHTEVALLAEVEEALTGGKVEGWPAIKSRLSTFGVCFLDHSGSVLKPYEFKMEEIEGFRYRCRVSVPCQDLSVLCHSRRARAQTSTCLRWFADSLLGALSVCRTPCAPWPSRRWERPGWRRSSRSC